MYVYLGPTVASPAFSSLPTKYAKAAYAIALPVRIIVTFGGLPNVLTSLQNFLIAGALYSHTASKIFFVRMFRKSDHLHEHTVIGWATWAALIILCNGIAFLLAVAIPVSYRTLSFPALVHAANKIPDIQLPCWNCSRALRSLVHLWSCWSILVV